MTAGLYTRGSGLWKLHIAMWFSHQSTENLSGTGSLNQERTILCWPPFQLGQSDMWKCVCKASVFTVTISLSTLKKGSKTGFGSKWPCSDTLKCSAYSGVACSDLACNLFLSHFSIFLFPIIPCHHFMLNKCGRNQIDR